MNIEKTIRKISNLREIAKEVLAEDMSEVHMVQVDEEDIEALQNVIFALECIRLTNEVFKKEDRDG